MTPWDAAFGDAIECVFLDAGGVLFHDEPVELHYLSRVAGRLGIAAGGFFAARERLLRAGSPDWIHALGRELAGSGWDAIVAESWDETLAALDHLCIPCPGALEAVAALAARYRLCCVANQPAPARAVLRRLGFAAHLEQVLLDTEVGVSKPDPRIFQQGLAAMAAEPSAAVFVGDRLENDIAPALRLGMRTVWLRRTPRYFRPEGVEEEFAAAYHASLLRLWHHNGPAAETAAAHLMGGELAALVLPSGKA